MDFKPLIHWLQNQIKTGFFWSRIENPKDISDPIVKAIRDKEYETLDPLTVSEPIVSALEDTTRAIEAIQIPEVKIPEVDFSEVVSSLRELINKKDKDIVIKQGDTKVVVDTNKLLKVLKKIEEKKPQEQIDYTLILADICDAIENKKEVDLSKIEKFLDEFKFPELPLEDGRVKVSLTEEQMNKIQAHFIASDHLANKDNKRINPATEEKQDDIVTELQKITENTEHIEINADTINLNTDEIEDKLDTIAGNQLPDGHEVEVNNFPSDYATEENQDKLASYKTQALDDYTTTSVTYVCKMKPAGTWLFIKIDETGNFPTFTYANVSNNGTKTTYALAYADRTTLTYGLLNTLTL
jgi:uncharacterized protein YpmS